MPIHATIQRVLVMLLVICPAVRAMGRQLSGRVLAETDSIAIEGAVCRLAGTPTGVTTDASGLFALEIPASTEATLEVAMTGFEPTEIMVSAKGGDLALGDIYLTPGEQLGEVTVTAGRVAEAKGRTIVFPSQTEVKGSSTAIELFQKLPLVGLDANPITRSLTVDGGEPVILINGLPSTADDVQALKPDDILKVEYSRVTPARYADRGANGLISITLRERADGGSVFAWGRSAVTTAFVDATINASYHQGPSQFSLSYQPSWRNYTKVYDERVGAYIGDDFRVDLRESDRDPFNYFINNLSARYDFTPTERTMFSATFRGGISDQNNEFFGHTDDSALGVYDNNRVTHNSRTSPSLDLFMHHDFNSSNSLEAQVVGSLSETEYRYDNRYFYADGTGADYRMDVDADRRSLITELTYTHTFSQKTTLSGGVQNTLSHSRNRYLTEDGFRPVLTENNNYIYASLGQQVGNVYLSLSTGAKLYWVNNDEAHRRYIRNISSVQAYYGMSSKWSLTAVVRYDPSIPGLSMLTDYMQQTSPYLYTNGNPDLKAASTIAGYLMPVYRHGKVQVGLTAGCANTFDDFISDVIYLGDGKFLSRTVNARRSSQAFGSAEINISDLGGFGLNARLAYHHFSSGGNGWNHHLNTLSGSLTAYWTKGPCTVMLWGLLPGKSLDGHSVSREENGTSLTFMYRVNKHLVCQAQWMYIADPKGTRYPSWNYSAVNPGHISRHISNNGNMVVLALRYTADFGSIFRAGRRSLNNTDAGSSIRQL